METRYKATRHLPGWIHALKTDFLAAFPNRTKAPDKSTVRRLVEKLARKGKLVDCHSRAMGGMSGHPVTVLTPAKFRDVDAAIKADFGTLASDPTVNTCSNNNVNLKRSSFSVAARKLKNISYHLVTLPAATDGVPALRVRFCKAWLALTDEERLNIAYSDETQFTLGGGCNSSTMRRYAVPERKGGTGRPPNLQVKVSNWEKKLMVFLCKYSIKVLIQSVY